MVDCRLGLKSLQGGSRIEICKSGEVIVWYVHGYLFLTGKDVPSIYDVHENDVGSLLRTPYRLSKRFGVNGIGLLWGTADPQETSGGFAPTLEDLSSIWTMMPEYRREITESSFLSWYPELYFWG